MVHFSDESKFNLFGSDGKRFVRYKNGKCLSPQCVKKTVKLEVGVMVWGMISAARVGTIHFHGNINASAYIELLSQHALPHLCQGTVETPIFTQDHAPWHKVKTEQEGIALMKWPPQSPDMNPLENVWKVIREKAQNRNLQNIDDL